MAADPAGRAQDQGRRHRRAGAPSAETTALLDRYHAAMRAELASLLGELSPAPVTQTSMLGDSDRPIGLGITARTERWTLAVKIARELGTEIDATPLPEDAPARRRRAAPDFG